MTRRILSFASRLAKHTHVVRMSHRCVFVRKKYLYLAAGAFLVAVVAVGALVWVWSWLDLERDQKVAELEQCSAAYFAAEGTAGTRGPKFWATMIAFGEVIGWWRGALSEHGVEEYLGKPDAELPLFSPKEFPSEWQSVGTRLCLYWFPSRGCATTCFGVVCDTRGQIKKLSYLLTPQQAEDLLLSSGETRTSPIDGTTQRSTQRPSDLSRQ